MRLSIIAPLPALYSALVAITGDAPVTTVDLSWLLNGSQLLLDETGQVFLLLTAIVWLCSALLSLTDTAAIQQRPRFYFCFLLAMAGNIGVVLAGELALFYTCFALMSFAAYGLIVTNDDVSIVRAGRVYITLVIIGEVLLFAAFVVIAQISGSSTMTQWQTLAPAAVTVPLIIFGFGIKVGAIPWHFVLPVTYSAAPTSAAVALGGAMLNAGLLGWLRFLPLGQTSLPDAGTTLIVLGLLAAFAGALIGIMQTNPKALLGYSSVSQVGLMTVMVGLTLVDHGQWETKSAVLLIYVLHHALAKGALFYAVSMTAARSRLAYSWQCIALLLPALSIAGAPLTTGALVKVNFKAAISAAPDPWSVWLAFLLPLSSFVTALLLIRFAALVWPKRPSADPGTNFNTAVIGQIVLIPAVAGCAWLVADAKGLGTLSLPMKGGYLWASIWPLLLAGAAAVVVSRMLTVSRRQLPRIPAGDILLPLELMIRYILTTLSKISIWIGRSYQQAISLLPGIVLPDSLQSAERLFRAPFTVGVLFTIIFIGILLALNASQ
jgi:formate hydrogenlyase subunit 3/multisubunit Na+/H+ antiporter MnhD subunit